ncbi:ribonuclease H-like domain-containing protein, partial [Tanacetum coccineum]
MMNYIKHIESHTQQQLKRYSFDELKELFETTMKNVNTFVPIETEDREKASELAAGSSQQKTNEASESVQEHPDEEEKELPQEDLQQMMMVVPVEEVYKFDRDDLVKLWDLVKERFSTTKPIYDKEKELWVELKRLFEPDSDDTLWKLQWYMHDPLVWIIYDTCGVHHVSLVRGHDIFMLVEKDYPLSKGVQMLMLGNKLLVEQHSEMIWMKITSLWEDCWDLNLSYLVLPREEFTLPSLVSTVRVEDSTARRKLVLPFKNKENNQFCERKGIKREFSVARTPQQNGVAERKNRTLIEATRTMLADSKLPTTFWAEAVNIACYVQNRVLVTKPHNKTPYELFLGRKPALGFMRPFGCPVTILNTIDHLGKFNGKADEGFFVGYSINSKAFRVFNSRTRIVEENLHVQFSENTPNIAGSTQACDDAGKMETVPGKDYILLPLWPTDPLFSQSSKSSLDAEFKPLGDDEKKVTKRTEEQSGGFINVVGTKSSIELPDDPNMPELEDIVYLDDDEDIGTKADMNNLDAFMPVSPILTTRIHKDHPVEQIIGDLNSAP